MSSLSSDPATTQSLEPTTSILLFPSFQRLSIPHSPQNFRALSSAYLSVEKLHPAHEAAGLTEEQKHDLVRDSSSKSYLPAPQPITTPVILICGHGGRDERCGILGPILVQRFWSVLKEKGLEAEVGTISHVGGHKFAGNVIIYMPPGPERTHAENEEPEQREKTLELKGTGLWYGRVGPENIAGIVEETIINGRIIADLFRGGVSQKGDNLGRLLEEQLKRDGAGEEGALNLKPKPRAKRAASSNA
jgi:(2Fe-2S) ferredoxin